MPLTRACLVWMLLCGLAPNAFAECRAPKWRPGKQWIDGESPVYTASMAVVDFTPERMVCLAETLKRLPELRQNRHFRVLVFSSHEAAMCYHGPIDFGDRITIRSGRR